jgi:hypothetical protein
VFAVGCRVTGLFRSRRLFWLRNDIDKELRKLFDEVGKEP